MIMWSEFDEIQYTQMKKDLEEKWVEKVTELLKNINTEI